MVQKHSADTIQIIKDKITYQLIPADEGGYVVRVTDYPSCLSQGETIDEALANIEDALIGCLTVDQEQSLSIPKHLEAWLEQVLSKREKTHQDSSTNRAYPSA